MGGKKNVARKFHTDAIEDRNKYRILKLVVGDYYAFNSYPRLPDILDMRKESSVHLLRGTMLLYCIFMSSIFH